MINVPLTAMDLGSLAKFHKFQFQVNAARVSHFLDAETCEFWQDPSLSMEH